MKFVAFILCLFFITSALAESSSKVWGRIVKADHLNYKYFVTYEENGKFHAYPIELKSKTLQEKISKNVGSLMNVKGELKTITIQTEGPAQKIPVFVAEELEPLTLSQLNPGNKVDIDPKLSNKIPESYNGGGIRINDTLANTLIIGTGAVMVGSAILKSLNKK